jgi:hypothetical protein
MSETPAPYLTQTDAERLQTEARALVAVLGLAEGERAEAAGKLAFAAAVLRPWLEDVRRALILKSEAKGLSVEVMVEGDALIAQADSQRLAQVIGNLAGNAVKYGASGKRVLLRAVWAHDRVRIEVIDFGPGLSLEKQAQLFEPFNRLGLENRRLSQTGKTLAQEAGGLSGAPLRGRALEVIRRLRATAGPALPLIGVGGIDSPEAAWERITAGASLIQLYTGWIYQGPGLVPAVGARRPVLRIGAQVSAVPRPARGAGAGRGGGGRLSSGGTPGMSMSWRTGNFGKRRSS